MSRFCGLSMFCGVVLSVLFSIVIILVYKGELVALLQLCSYCHKAVHCSVSLARGPVG